MSRQGFEPPPPLPASKEGLCSKNGSGIIARKQINTGSYRRFNYCLENVVYVTVFLCYSERNLRIELYKQFTECSHYSQEAGEFNDCIYGQILYASLCNEVNC